jgi:hypothetical protein
MRRGRAFLLLGTAGLTVAFAREAPAAELTVDAPPACAEPATLAEEVGELIGRPLTEVAGFDFHVRIGETSPGKWRLRLETVAGKDADAPTVGGSREIDGTTCAELAEAASVAIAVSVQSMEAARREPPPASLTPPSPSPAHNPAAPPTAAIAANAPAKPTWRASATLALTTNTGALPSTSPGLEVEGGLQRGALRLVILGSWFTSQDTVGFGGVGGTFQLALGGALGCYAPRAGRWTLLACGGAELGRLAGTGLDVARPQTAAVLWRAVLAEAGTTVAVGANTAILLRAGVSFPLARQEFVLDQSQQVYRPSPVAVRLTVGFELGF